MAKLARIKAVASSRPMSASQGLQLAQNILQCSRANSWKVSCCNFACSACSVVLQASSWHVAVKRTDLHGAMILQFLGLCPKVLVPGAIQHARHAALQRIDFCGAMIIMAHDVTSTVPSFASTGLRPGQRCYMKYLKYLKYHLYQRLHPSMQLYRKHNGLGCCETLTRSRLAQMACKKT